MSDNILWNIAATWKAKPQMKWIERLKWTVRSIFYLQSNSVAANNILAVWPFWPK